MKDMADHDTDKSVKSGSPEAIAQEVKNATTGMLKRLFKIDWDTVAQLGAPKIRRRAEEDAKRAKQSFPVDAWVRSDAAEVIYNVVLKQVKNAVEVLKDGALKTSLKELAEYLETFVVEFCNEEDGGYKNKKVSKQIDPETAKVVAEYKKAIMASIQTRLDAASDADYNSVSASADKRMRDGAKMVGYMTDGIPEEKEVRPKGPSLGEQLEEFAHAATPVLNQLETKRQAYAAETARRSAQRRRERAAQPKTVAEKVFKLLFGF